LWVLLLLFAVVVKPALVLASETHESGHAVQTGHSHDALEDAHHIPSDELSAVGDADPWHALMHMGHCCSHPSAAPAGTGVLDPVLPQLAPAMPPIRRQANAGVQELLRPPIRA
jgi:hypothetical protein